MKENKKFVCAGDLKVEVEQSQKASRCEEIAEMGRTSTLGCSTFLTIYCC